MSATSGPRGSYARGRATREEIVNVARDVLVQRGYHGMTFVAVAERAGITRAGLIHHFPSKEHLLLAVMEDRFSENGQWMMGQLEAGKPVLDIFVDLMSRLTASRPQSTLLLALGGASIDSSHPAHDWYVARYRYMRPTLTEHVVDNQRRGLIVTRDTPDQLAIQLIGTIEGILLQWLYDPDAVDAVAVMRGFCDSLRPS